ncbi:MAG: phosphatase PAP2 family protein [Saprospirales bacterium]|nr:phosphatase PAP2 family protein [Saprospirales bacterium]
MKTIRENPFFFAAFTIWLVWGGVWLLTHQTGDAILFWSAHRSSFGNAFFKLATHLGEGIVYLVVILLALLARYRHSLLVLGTGLAVMLTSYVTKALFAQERPLAFLRRFNQLDQINLVDGVNLHSGDTSFPSGHTMAAFALFALIAFLVKFKRLPALLFFLLALSVAVSRLYLVQHFMKDVYAGSIIGVALAMIIYALQKKLPLSA